MAVSVRKAQSSDAHSVCELLRNSTLNSAWIPVEKRKRMFRPVWGGDEGYYGYVLEDDGEVVGFLGTLFTVREINGEKHKFCEIHSWYVKEEYRNESMMLYMPIASMRKTTLLNYTPTESVYDIGKKFGWDDLESRICQFLPVPTPGSVRFDIRVETRKHKIAHYLDPADLKIFHDHEDLDCRHLLVTKSGSTDYLYVILKRLRLGRFVPFGRIVYASDPAMLLETVHHLKMRWCARYGLAFLITDRDGLDAEALPAFTRIVDREVPSQYKSKHLKAEDFRTSLYNLPMLIGYRLH